MKTALDIPLIPSPAHLEARTGAWEGTDPLAALTCEVTDDLDAGEFELEIGENAIAARGGSDGALVNARLTLEQIAELCRNGEEEHVRIPALILRDHPRFSWRGLHIDPCRHFLPMEEVRRIVDVMGLYRLNNLHLHLTDDQGWRIEIDGYPRLTEVAAWRERTVIGHHNVKDPSADQYLEEHHGGYYTQAELRDLVAFARERGITVVPEIDLPGHMQAAIAAYPEFGAWPKVQHKVRDTWGVSEHVLGVSDKAFQFVKDVLTQVCDIFDAPYVHIGGDEVPRVEWENNPAVEAKLREWGLSEPGHVQQKYTQFAHALLTDRGRAMVGWDELLEGELPEDTVIMNWRSAETVADAARRGHDVVVSTAPTLYFDFPQSADRESEPLAARWGGHVSTLENVYTNQLLPEGLSAEESAHILGLQAQMWSEFIPNAEHLQYMLFPRLFALAERNWNDNPPAFEDFLERVPAHLEILERKGLRYRALR